MYQNALNEHLARTSKPAMGGEAVRDLLRKIDPEYLSKKLRIDLKETKSEAQIEEANEALESR